MATSVVLRCALAAVMLAPQVAFSGEPLELLPAEVNAAASIDVAAIYQSPLAVKQQWSKKSMQALLANEVVIPPGVETLTVGARMSYKEDLSSQSEYAVATVSPQLTLEKLAGLTGGALDELLDRPVLTNSRGSLIVAQTDSRWLVTGAGGRQAAARWMRSLESSTGPAGPLKVAFQRKRADEQVVLAFDLADQFSVRELTDWLSEPPPPTGSVKQAAELLSTLQSVAFYMAVGDEIAGRVEIRFAAPAAAIAPALPALRDRVMQRLGATLPDLESWKATVEKESISAHGRLSPQSARRLLSLLNPPGDLNVAAQVSEMSAGNSVQQQVAASQRYYRSIRSTLDDIQETLKKAKANEAMWLDKAARQLDELPLLNVDESLTELSGKISGSLRYQAQAERMSNIRSGTRMAQTGARNVYGYAYYGPFGGVSVGTGNPVSSSAISAEENLSSMNVRVDEMKAIEDAMTQIRQDLTKKYQVEF